MSFDQDFNIRTYSFPDSPDSIDSFDLDVPIDD